MDSFVALKVKSAFEYRGPLHQHFSPVLWYEATRNFFTPPWIGWYSACIVLHRVTPGIEFVGSQSLRAWKNNLNSRMPLGKRRLKFWLSWIRPSFSFNDLLGSQLAWSFARHVKENEKWLAQKENLHVLVLVNSMAFFSSPDPLIQLSRERGPLSVKFLV